MPCHLANVHQCNELPLPWCYCYECVGVWLLLCVQPLTTFFWSLIIWSEDVMLELSSANSSSSSANSPGVQQSSVSETKLNQHFFPMITLSEPSKSFNIFGQSSSPLNALHNMSDLTGKLNLSTTSDSVSYHSTPLNMKSCLGQMTSSSSSSPIPCSTSSTSHYISDILNRPTSFSSAVPSSTFGSALTGALPRFPLGSVPSSVCFTAAAAAANGLTHKIGPLNDLPSRHLYWPSMVQNTNLWRERLANAGNWTTIFSELNKTLKIWMLWMCFSEPNLYWEGWQKETYQTYLLRTPNICLREDFWTDQIPGRTRKS